MENLNQGYEFAKLSALKEFADMVYTTVDGNGRNALMIMLVGIYEGHNDHCLGVEEWMVHISCYGYV